MVWLSLVQRELGPFFTRHYIPVWRELWVPAMNARLVAGQPYRWVVPRTGTYRVYVSRELARHPWFRRPLFVASYKRSDASRFTVALPAPSLSSVRLLVDGVPVVGPTVVLRQGQRIEAQNPSSEDVAVILLSTDDRTLFRQPPAGVTLEGETTRITHIPHIGAMIEP